MRILHFIHDHPAHPTIGGGGAIRAWTFARWLAGRGHRVRLISGWFEGCEAHAAKDSDAGIETRFIGPKTGRATKAALYAAAAAASYGELTRDAEIVIEDFSPHGPIGACFRRNKNHPVVLQIQNYMGRELLRRHGIAGLPLMAIERALPPFYANRIFQTPQLARRFPGGRANFVIPSGIDAGMLLVPSGSEDYAAFLGRIDYHQKGIDILLAAAAKVDVPLRIAGDGPDVQRLQRDLASHPTARYVGKVAGAEKISFLKHAAFMAQPSRFEGQMMVVVEAAAMGKPSLVSDIPELHYVSAESIGQSFAPNNATALAAAMRQLWDDTATRRSLGRRAREYARAFSWEELAGRYEDALAQIVRGGRNEP